MTRGRVTMPIETGIDDQLAPVLERLGADAVRNSDGTELPPAVRDLGARVYATYFVARGDQDWALAHPESRTHVYLSSARVPALAAGPLAVRIMDGYFADQVTPDLDCDRARWWQVMDRTTGAAIPAADWNVAGAGPDTAVTILDPTVGHVYSVSFLAYQQWDSTQMYNYLTNGWEDDPHRHREIPYDVRHPATWQHMRDRLAQWLSEHPEVDVVRFTTFFYHFTLIFDASARERFVDWFGYSASVSVPAMEAFEAEYGYALTPEDFIDQGYLNSPFRPPRRAFRDWIAFQHRFVTERVGELVDLVHDAGKEAMMFLGDNWIGTEPYGELFAATGMDAVVGSVGSAATCRMISDIPEVTYTEGRFLPYFFPDVFCATGDPVGEANASWLQARRAIVRSPLDRIGYGGYLSLALEFPDFVDRVAEICDEFRELHDRSGGERPATVGVTVAILNAWGSLRSWQTHMVAHALPHKQTVSYVGVVEALAGQPVDVRFLSFDDVRSQVPDDIDVIINVGAAGTAFSGGDAWLDQDLQRSLRRFVADGGGFIGVGEPTAVSNGGVIFQLADVLGVDREFGWSLSTDRYPRIVDEHLITADGWSLDPGRTCVDVVAIDDATDVLSYQDEAVRLAARRYGDGRGVYFAGLPYSPENARLLLRAICWAARREQAFADGWQAESAWVETAHYEHARTLLVFNNATHRVETTVSGPGTTLRVALPPMGRTWIDLA